MPPCTYILVLEFWKLNSKKQSHCAILCVHLKIWQTPPNCLRSQIMYQSTLPPAVCECASFSTTFPAICLLLEICEEAICQTAEEAKWESVYDEYTWHLVESQGSFRWSGWLKGGPPHSLLHGEHSWGMVDEGHWGTLLHFDLKSAPQSTATQGQHALMADNMLCLYSSWI